MAEGRLLAAEATTMLAASMRRALIHAGSEASDRHVTVASFNMLLKGFEGKEYYPHVPVEQRAWEYRKPELRKVMTGMQADILCVQEAEVLSFWQEFEWMDGAGYDAVEPRDGKATPPRSPPRGEDGPPVEVLLSKASKDLAQKRPEMAKCAILFKKERVELLWTEHKSRTVVASFRHRPSGEVLYVVNCHLEGHPQQAATRFRQMQSALQAVSKEQKKAGHDNGNSSLVFCGDFNGPPDGGVCHCLRTGAMCPDFRDPWAPEEPLVKERFEIPHRLRDLYEDAGWPATFLVNEPTSIDFLFYTPSRLRAVGRRRPFTDEQFEVARREKLPCAFHVSDHVPIGGVFEFAEKGDEIPEPAWV